MAGACVGAERASRASGRAASWKGEIEHLVEAILPCARRTPAFLPSADGKKVATICLQNRTMWNAALELHAGLSFSKTDVQKAFTLVLEKVEKGWPRTLGDAHAREDWVATCTERFRKQARVIANTSRSHPDAKWIQRLRDTGALPLAAVAPAAASATPAEAVASPTPGKPARLRRASPSFSQATGGDASLVASFIHGVDWDSRTVWRMHVGGVAGTESTEVLNISALKAESTGVYATWRSGVKTLFAELTPEDLGSVVESTPAVAASVSERNDAIRSCPWKLGNFVARLVDRGKAAKVFCYLNSDLADAAKPGPSDWTAESVPDGGKQVLQVLTSTVCRMAGDPAGATRALEVAHVVAMSLADGSCTLADARSQRDKAIAASKALADADGKAAGTSAAIPVAGSAGGDVGDDASVIDTDADDSLAEEGGEEETDGEEDKEEDTEEDDEPIVEEKHVTWAEPVASVATLMKKPAARKCTTEESSSKNPAAAEPSKRRRLGDKTTSPAEPTPAPVAPATAKVATTKKAAKSSASSSAKPAAPALAPEAKAAATKKKRAATSGGGTGDGDADCDAGAGAKAPTAEHTLGEPGEEEALSDFSNVSW